MRKQVLPIAPSPMDERAAQLEEEFSYDGYQVVRRELFSHLRSPAVTIRTDCVSFNAACIRGLKNVVYIHILINPDTRRMVIKPCEEDDKNALRWCLVHSDKRDSRIVSSKRFSAMLYNLLQWDENYRYRILGYRIKAEGEQIYVFDLLEPEFVPDYRKKKGAPESDTDGEPKKRKRAAYMALQKDTPTEFGVSLAKNQAALQLDLMDYQESDDIDIPKGRR